MPIVEFLRRESDGTPIRWIILVAVAALSNAAVLMVINAAAEHVDSRFDDLRNLVLFLTVAATYAVSQRFIMRFAGVQIEAALHRLRVRMADKIAATELATLEQIGHTRIYAGLSKDSETLSHTGDILVVALQSALLVLFVLIYLAILSPPAFLFAAAVTALALGVHFRKMAEITRDERIALERENRLMDGLTGLLSGFKEVKVHSGRRHALQADLLALSHGVADIRTELKTKWASHFVFSQLSFYFLAGAMIFIVPAFGEAYPPLVVKTTTTMLFLMGPVANVVSSLPSLANANAACGSIRALEQHLDRSVEDELSQTAFPLPFRTIELKGAAFSHTDAAGNSGFTVGPIDLTIRSGEVLFITGGNGTGKSTLVKMLTGLYRPQHGTILVDGVPVDRSTAQSYRNLFSVIFSDFHLFRKLYGLDGVTPERVADLLEWLEIAGKTAVADGTFQTLDLSSGQRKRVGLLVSLLEDRPLLVFDEWAADQDPPFRRKFYTEIIPHLKAQGRTVIAITHDDRYFDCCDRAVRIEEGRIATVTPGRPAESLQNPGVVGAV